MKFKIAIGNIVDVRVKFSMRDGAVDRDFSFTLTAKRVPPEEIEEQPSEQSVREFLLANVTGWSGQRLVQTENGDPAPFSPEAFEYMIKQPGALAVIWSAYLRTAACKEKN